ncbi:uncharacterized protein PITG_01189 [Phytophthora infestans T30-4]|uniref:Uncharacterized protein n=1 Tax=Phytophthora infestans (strain T30-4) TaxID=403677 RepID=D0MUV4_PHYIT|nr:uncharacterized protein PITG_01189 [Phytophthora infestans T30-4]EEY60950.1 hypothetical protein PITG_01189 [Phytophthora infestans T30-4]|eukprot:XP_002907867.1 hypothetical protein PITG_01189 [Phytophthora infestans T30-4]
MSYNQGVHVVACNDPTQAASVRTPPASEMATAMAKAPTSTACTDTTAPPVSSPASGVPQTRTSRRLRALSGFYHCCGARSRKEHCCCKFITHLYPSPDGGFVFSASPYVRHRPLRTQRWTYWMINKRLKKNCDCLQKIATLFHTEVLKQYRCVLNQYYAAGHRGRSSDFGGRGQQAIPYGEEKSVHGCQSSSAEAGKGALACSSADSAAGSSTGESARDPSSDKARGGGGVAAGGRVADDGAARADAARVSSVTKEGDFQIRPYADLL